MNPTLPWEPEAFESCRARFDAAVEPLWDADGIKSAHKAGEESDRPGRHRRHVFDFELHGRQWRMIVSRERVRAKDGEVQVIIHASFSMQADAGGVVPGNLAEAYVWAVEDFALLAGLPEPMLPAQAARTGAAMHMVFPVELLRLRHG